MSNNSINSTVELEIIVDGKNVCESYICKSIYIEKEVIKIPYAIIEFFDGDPTKSIFEASESGDFKIGNNVEIKLGYGSETNQVFKGVIVKTSIQIHENETAFAIICKDAAYVTMLRRKSTQFNNNTDSQVISKILEDYPSLEKDIENTDIRYESLIQNRLSDWDFICIRSEANGHLVWCDDGKLYSKKPSTENSSSKSFSFGENIIEMRLDLNKLSNN